MKQLAKCGIALVVMIYNWSNAVGSIDSATYNKHSIGVNFLRITDVYYIDFPLEGGFSNIPGLVYTYQLKPKLSLRSALFFDQENYTINRIDLILIHSKSYSVKAGFQSPLIKKTRGSNYLFLDGAIKHGKGETHYIDNFGRTRPININYSREIKYESRNYGIETGLGWSYLLSNHISFNIETGFVLSEVKTRYLNTNRRLIQHDNYFNPVSRLSINYTINQ